MGFSLKPKARADLDEIWDYTEQRWNADQADRYIRQIVDLCDTLASGRLRGTNADQVRPGYLKALTGSHVLYLRILKNGTVEIVRILHQRMDAGRHL